MINNESKQVNDMIVSDEDINIMIVKKPKGDIDRLLKHSIRGNIERRYN